MMMDKSNLMYVQEFNYVPVSSDFYFLHCIYYYTVICYNTGTLVKLLNWLYILGNRVKAFSKL